MDKIFLHGLRAQTLIGLYEWERQQSQTVVFDLDIGLSLPFASNDDIHDTVHYGEVCVRLREYLSKQHFLLLETLATETARHLFAQFDGIAWLKLRVVKLGILPHVQQVGVEIERYREMV